MGPPNEDLSFLKALPPYSSSCTRRSPSSTIRGLLKSPGNSMRRGPPKGPARHSRRHPSVTSWRTSWGKKMVGQFGQNERKLKTGTKMFKDVQKHFFPSSPSWLERWKNWPTFSAARAEEENEQLPRKKKGFSFNLRPKKTNRNPKKLMTSDLRLKPHSCWCHSVRTGRLAATVPAGCRWLWR